MGKWGIFDDKYKLAVIIKPTMKIRLAIVLVISILTTNLYPQTELVTKKEVKRIIKKGFSTSSDYADSWDACNDDSLYFKTDTINFYNNSNYFYQVGHCCQFVEWQFFKRKAVRRQEYQRCIEPPRIYVASYFYFKYKIVKRKKMIIIKTFRNDNFGESFKVVRIEDVILPSGRKSGIRIVLVRINE